MNDIKILKKAKKHWEYMRGNNPTDKVCYVPAKDWASNCLLCDAAKGACIDCIMRNGWGVLGAPVVVSCVSSKKSVYKTWLNNKLKENCQGVIDALQRKIDSLTPKEKAMNAWLSQDLSDLKVGGDVYSLLQGRGKVVVLDAVGAYPIKCKFDTFYQTFTAEGKYLQADKHQCLFKGKQHPFNPQPNPFGLRIGDSCLTKDAGDKEWEEVVFRGYIELGKETLWFVNSPKYGGLVEYNQAKLLSKTKTVVKSAPAIMELLTSQGYTVDLDGDWCRSDTDKAFVTRMWQYCGKTPHNNWAWEPKWLEEKELMQ